MRIPGFLLLLASLVWSQAFAQDIREVRVQFDAGRSGATIEGRIKGYEIVDYVLGARRGQNIAIDLGTDNLANYFNLLPAGSETAIHIGSVNGNEYRGALPADGDYRIRVYMMRSAARRDEVANYRLSVDIGADGAASAPDPDFADGLSGGPDYWAVSGVSRGDLLNVRTAPGTKSAVIGQLANGDRVRNLGCRMVAKSRWCQVGLGGDQGMTGWVNGRYLVEAGAPPQGGGANTSASGEVPCSTALGQPTGRCAFRVTRGGNGNAGVWIALPDGRERYIDFRDGVPVGTDPGLKLSFERMSDLMLIRIGGVERYEIPDAVVFGG